MRVCVCGCVCVCEFASAGLIKLDSEGKNLNLFFSFPISSVVEESGNIY